MLSCEIYVLSFELLIKKNKNNIMFVYSIYRWHCKQWMMMTRRIV